MNFTFTFVYVLSSLVRPCSSQCVDGTYRYEGRDCCLCGVGTSAWGVISLRFTLDSCPVSFLPVTSLSEAGCGVSIITLTISVHPHTPGLHLSEHCTENLKSGKCDLCKPGTYSSEPTSQMSCEPCTSCSHVNGTSTRPPDTFHSHFHTQQTVASL